MRLVVGVLSYATRAGPEKCLFVVSQRDVSSDNDLLGFIQQNLVARLDELDRLEGPGRDELSGWEARARARIAALDAAREMSGQLGLN